MYLCSTHTLLQQYISRMASLLVQHTPNSICTVYGDPIKITPVDSCTIYCDPINIGPVDSWTIYCDPIKIRPVESWTVYCDPTPLYVASCHMDDDLDVATCHIDDVVLDISRLFQDESTICCCGSLEDSIAHKYANCVLGLFCAHCLG